MRKKIQTHFVQPQSEDNSKDKQKKLYMYLCDVNDWFKKQASRQLKWIKDLTSKKTVVKVD